MTEIIERYEVRYTYYQYNSGQADNGTYSATVIAVDREAAALLTQRIRKSASGNVEDDEDAQEAEQELRNDLMPHHGFFIDARVFHVRSEETQIAD